MQDVLTWGAVIAAGGSLVALAKFWMDMGQMAAKAEEARTVAQAAVGQYHLLDTRFNDFKAEQGERSAKVETMIGVIADDIKDIKQMLKERSR